ncbi:hypothetical protein OROGR_018467 [Orobanche gracilis]
MVKLIPILLGIFSSVLVALVLIFLLLVFAFKKDRSRLAIIFAAIQCCVGVILIYYWVMDKYVFRRRRPPPPPQASTSPVTHGEM